MRKLAVLCTLVLFTAVFAGGLSAAETLLFEDFEVEEGTLPVGWYVARGEPGVVVERTSGRHALRIRPRTAEWDGAFALFEEVTDRVILEFDAYTPGASRTLAASVSFQEDPDEGATTDFGAYLTVRENGVVAFYVDGWYNLGTIDTSGWNHYRLDVDVASQTFRVYVNDMDRPLGTGIFRNTLDRLNQVEFSTWGHDNLETLWVDDVRVERPE